MPVKYKATGTSHAILANRLSWFYDLKGTSFAVDSACSSSLVALHQAVLNLRAGDSHMVRHFSANTGIGFVFDNWSSLGDRQWSESYRLPWQLNVSW
jgi:hypothetical protein